MIPQPRTGDPLRPSAPTQDLRDLHERYHRLPHLNVRYQTPQGDAFRMAVVEAVSRYGRHVVAEALQITIQGVDYIVAKRRPTSLVAYPDDQQIEPLVAAWETLQKRVHDGPKMRITLQRSTREYEAVHRELARLVSAGFELRIIALAAGIRARDLSNYTQPASIIRTHHALQRRS